MALSTPSHGSPPVLCVRCPQQPVHPPAGPALVDFYLNFDLRPSTQKLYAAQQTTFLAICAQLGVDASAALSERDLCCVVATFARSHKVTTVPIFVAAVAYRAHSLNHGKLPRHELFRRVKRGIENFHADQVVTPKTAITMSDLLAFHGLLDHSTFEGARDWCACTLAFFGLLRINEYCNGHLRHGHVQHTAAGVMMTIAYSKTSLSPARVDIASRADVLCPSRALSQYLAFFSAYPRLPHSPQDPLFIIRRVPSGFRAMSDVEFIAIVRSLMQRVSPGCDPAQYAGHSFRRGGTSALKLAGVADSSIQLHGRWKSDAYRAYIDVDHSIALRLLATQALPSVSSVRQ
jgi:hypothetical protein